MCDGLAGTSYGNHKQGEISLLVRVLALRCELFLQHHVAEGAMALMPLTVEAVPLPCTPVENPPHRRTSRASTDEVRPSGGHAQTTRSRRAVGRPPGPVRKGADGGVTGAGPAATSDLRAGARAPDDSFRCLLDWWARHFRRQTPPWRRRPALLPALCL